MKKATNPTIIKDTETTLDWFDWMREAKPSNYQCWKFTYCETGNISTQYENNIDFDWAWKNRRIINDWMRRIIKDITK